MTIKETQQAEIVVDPKTLSPEQQVTDATQQEEDYQPKILAILDKIESNTSALLRREPLAGGSTLVQSSTHQNNTDSVSNKHQSNAQQVFNASREAAQRPVSRQAEKVPESGRPHQALPATHKATERDSQTRSEQAKHRLTERVHEQNNTLTSRDSDVVREVQASDHTQRTGDNESQQRERDSQVVIAGGESKPQETDSQPSKTPDAGAKAGQQVESKGNRQASVTPALATPVQKKEQKPRHTAPSVSPAAESKPTPAQNQREIERSDPQTSTQSVASTDNQPQDNAPDDKGSVTASQQAQEEQKEKRERSGLLKTVGDVFKKATEEREELEAGDTATDAAGSAMGGSLWEAAKEVKEATDDVKNSSLGQKVLEKVTGKKADSNEADDQARDDASSKEIFAKDNPHGPVRDEKGRFIKRAEAQALNHPAPPLEVEQKTDTHKALNEHQDNTKRKDESRQSEEHSRAVDESSNRNHTATVQTQQQTATSKEASSHTATDNRQDSIHDENTIQRVTQQPTSELGNKHLQIASQSHHTDDSREEIQGNSRELQDNHRQTDQSSASRSIDTYRVLDKHQNNTHKQSESEHQSSTLDKDNQRSAKTSAHQADKNSDNRISDTHKALDRYQNNTQKSRESHTQKQSESDRQSREVGTHNQTSVTSANVVREREQTRSNEAIADRLDEQYDLSQDQHKELIKTIDKKEFGGEGGGSLMDSVSELSDMFGGGDGKEKGGGKRRRGRGRKGRLGSLIDRFKGSKGAAGNASALKGAPTTRLGRVAQGVKNATGTLANSGVGKAAGGALKTVGSVASRAAAPVAALATGYFKYNEVKDREDLTGSQKAVQVGATTAGSLGGASAGAAMGAAMGSVVPVVGTLVGGLLGAAVGGWLGSKGGDIVGEAISDKMEGTDGKTRAEREAETLQSTTESSESVTTNGDKSELSTKNAESAQVVATSRTESSAQEAGAVHTLQASEAAVMPEQLKAPLPEISPSKAAMSQTSNKETHTEKTETVAKIDEKKLGKAIVDAMSKAQQQSGVSASASGPRYAASQSKSASVPAPIKTEFEDKTLVLMAHDRI
ncbi:hypothetical protein CAG67_15755 [Vibrio sp. V41_P2S12T139]|uniref:hypothetical protein n=1 Tax=Vibrio sp. V42_P2S4T144 TaxID=1938693 RepID=UPI001372AEEF|nr:hypothetical protein [Vibrio sp. V41_P2S12T139]NAW93370.1 hypothetical protein [Vibrio sp. V42_P2S4T144]